MKKILLLATPLICFGFLTLTISSCKDDEPPAKPKISMDSDARTVLENAGTIEVEVELDKAATEDLTIEYTIEGTATDLETAANVASADFDITGGSGELEIEKGESSGTIEINLYNDTGFEDNETIIITLDGEENNKADITEENVTTITITNDDSKVVASMATASITANEDDGAELLEVTINLDKPAPANTKVKYTLSGTALDSLTGFNEDVHPQYFDYYVDGVVGEVPISTGATSGSIKIQLYTDFQWEDTETIIFTLADSGPSVDLGTSNVTTVNLEQQDGTGIALEWEPTSVDMDMFLWIGDAVDNLFGPIASSAFEGKGPSVEGLIIPKTFPDAAFGLSHTYYEGTADPLTFTVSFIDYTDGQAEAEENWQVFTGNYTLANVNNWVTSQNLEIEQTFKQSAGALIEISAISTPTSGSRVKTAKLPGTFSKLKMRKGFLPPNLKR